MTNEQKARVLRVIAYHKNQLQAIEQGRNPDTQEIADRRKHAGWQIDFLLKSIAEALPAPLRQEVQDCLALNDRLWSVAYVDHYFEAQKEASPSCLPAADSL